MGGRKREADMTRRRYAKRGDWLFSNGSGKAEGSVGSREAQDFEEKDNSC